MRKQVVEITRSELAKIRRAYTPWEVQLLKLVHGSGNVVVKGELDDETTYPNRASAEYARLSKVYPRFEGEESLIVPVEAVFGKGEGGVMALGRKIREVIADAQKRPPIPPPPELALVDPEDVINTEADDEIKDPNAGAPAAETDKGDPALV